MGKIDKISVDGTAYEIVPEIAPLFDPSDSYSTGDCVIHDAVLYKFTANHTGIWTGNDVVAFEVGSELVRLGNGASGSGLTEDIKVALLACFEKVAWIDDDGQDYYDALYNALYPPADVVSISAVYTQSGTVYDTDTLNSLKTNLVVTAHMSDSTTQTVTNYTLSGTLAEGTSTITVSYGGKTTTFDVSVVHYTAPTLYNWDLKQSLTDTDQNLTVDTTGTFTQGTGLSLNGDNKYADFGAIYALNRTYEFEITALNRSNTNSYRRFFMTYKSNNTSTYGYGLTFTSQKGGIQFYTGSWQSAIITTSDITDLDGKWAIYTGTDGKWKVYKNGVYVGQSTTAIAKNTDHTNIYVGSSAADYTRVTISSLKVYEGEVIN